MNASTQRLFFALWPPAPVRVAIQSALPDVPGRRIPPENWHITLRFLGDVQPEAATQLRTAAAGIRIEQFNLQLDQMGYWRKPQVIWLGSESIPPPLAQLASRLEESARACGLPAENRGFQVHLTVARKVARSPRQLGAVTPIFWPVESFALMQSQLSNAGSLYTVVESWSLTN